MVPESPRGPAVNWSEWQEWQHRCCVCNWNTYNGCIHGICVFLVKTQNVVILFTIGPFKNSQHCVSMFIAKGNTTIYLKCKTPLFGDLFLIPTAPAHGTSHYQTPWKICGLNLNNRNGCCGTVPVSYRRVNPRALQLVQIFATHLLILASGSFREHKANNRESPVYLEASVKYSPS